MRRSINILRKSCKDLELLKALQSELKYEQSTNPFQVNVLGISICKPKAGPHWSTPPSLKYSPKPITALKKRITRAGNERDSSEETPRKESEGHQSGALGDFVLDWDAPQSQDVVLRRKCDSGEEVAVSALLGHEVLDGEGLLLPRQALMKVCIKKPGLSPVLQFDCGISSKGDDESEFAIHNAYYHRSLSCLGPSDYRGPLFSSLDPQLQDAFKEYLIARGIGEDLTNFVLLHLHRKEQGQYVNWLRKLEDMVAKNA